MFFLTKCKNPDHGVIKLPLRKIRNPLAHEYKDDAIKIAMSLLHNQFY